MSTNLAQGGLTLSDDRSAVLSFEPNGERTLSIPDSVKELPPALFAGCDSLVSVKLPARATSLPSRLFEGCSSLEKVRMPRAVSTFGESCFAGCSSLKSIPFSYAAKEISKDSFRGCASVQSVVVPEGVVAIREGALADCVSLQTIAFPSTLKVIERGAMSNCPSLRRIRVSEGNEIFYTSESDSCLYQRNPSGGDILVLEPSVGERSRVKLLRDESEIDFSTDEDDSDESLEALDNNFIGEDEQETAPAGAAAPPFQPASHNASSRSELGKQAEGLRPSPTCGGDIASSRSELVSKPKACDQRPQEANDIIEAVTASSPAPLVNNEQEIAQSSDETAQESQEMAAACEPSGESATKIARNALSYSKISKEHEGDEQLTTAFMRIQDEINEENAIAATASPAASDEIVVETQGIVSSSEETATEAQEVVSSSEEMVTESQEIAQSSEETAAEAQETASSSEESVVETQGIVSSIEETPQETQETSGDVDNMGDETQEIGETSEKEDVMDEENSSIEEQALKAIEDDILTQNIQTDGSVAVTQSELEALEAKGEVMDTVPEGYYGAPVEFVAAMNEESAPQAPTLSAEEVMVMRFARIASRHECVSLESGKGKTGEGQELFAFAERLVDDNSGGHFSTALLSCCLDIAKTRGFAKVQLFSGLPFEDDEFDVMFSHFIEGKHVVFACSAAKLDALSSNAKAFVESARMDTDASSQSKQRAMAAQDTDTQIQLLLQDDYSA